MSVATDDFIRSSGNLAYVNTWLKLIVPGNIWACEEPGEKALKRRTP